MKRKQALKMLHEFHEECIKAAKALKSPFHAIVDLSERTYTDGTVYSYTACIWNEETGDTALERRWGYIYPFWSDETCVEVYNENLEGFKADVEKITKQTQQA